MNRSPATSGIASLYRRERDVPVLVAEGYGNQQIAQRMFTARRLSTATRAPSS